ncbi:ABC-type antimicrobial peptide transport system, permease component [Mucilaginibacter gossypiicola]|uniref:ABC-type antimicrobial peptide transport system, permease component n=1 Tax=Mucilaginibacter gossypiicola TaxID=551995 RepID=A0A1H8QUB0_9SPHI|nr:FtsX-like permease family protein [Mucilaginibacter gossypiicola]SEO57518.1 ABC-type antimicrobial peptide transport system, permease component [Mucilaginibacter gossypiicola]
MNKNYFKIALRNLRIRKFFTFINIVGLSVGISAALAIFVIVNFDLSFDKFHHDSERIYRVVTDLSYMDKVVARVGLVNGPLPATIKAEVPGIKNVAPFLEIKETDVLIPGSTDLPVKFKKESNIVLANKEYFALFNYKWLAGSSQTALEKPYQVVLTSDQAQKYFPNISYSELLGRTVIYDSIKTAISGIIQAPAHNTDFYFKDFISYNTCLNNADLKNMTRLTEWPNVVWQLFIKIDEQANMHNVEKQINILVNKYNKGFRPGDGQTEHLQPLKDLHFNQDYANFNKGRRANKTTIYSLLAIAGFLLLLGCINFINLSTAQATQRAKEIGIRKTMGSSRWQLVVQFLSETFIVTFFAICIGVALTPLILQLFADFIPPGLSLNYLDGSLLSFLLALLIVVTLLAGLYPAIILSGYKPIVVLNKPAGNDFGNGSGIALRKALSVTQFVIAQFFIMTTLLVNKQIFYALNKDLGFNKDAIINIETPHSTINSNKQQLFKDKISRIPQIEMMSIGSEAPAAENIRAWEVSYKDEKKEIKTSLQQRNGDENYIKVYHIKLLAGRNLIAADSMTAVLVNEKYIHILGLEDPADAIGKAFDYEGNKRIIVGVVADFYQKSLRDAILPMSMQAPHYRFNDNFFHILLKPQAAGSDDWNKAINSMKSAWKEVYPDIAFDYHFFDDEVARFYENEQRTSKLLSWATGLSILISCLGLVGLTIFNTNRRTKEIGIRKVLGASAMQIVKLLSSEITWLVVVSFVVVMPLAWFAMNKWLQSFADRTPISWWIFALSGAIMFFTALLTSAFQTGRAALANPVKSLRNN